jgi:iron complex outermembrane recepter protein
MTIDSDALPAAPLDPNPRKCGLKIPSLDVCAPEKHGRRASDGTPAFTFRQEDRRMSAATMVVAVRRTMRRMTAWAMVAAPLAAAAPAAAQSIGTISGTVTHSQSGAPIVAVTVRAVGTPHSAVTRADGSYRLQLPAGRYEIQAGVLGFAAGTQAVAVAAGQTVTQNFSLAPSAVPLDQIVAVGTRRAGRTVTESPVPVDVIPAAAIANTGLIETSQILQRLTPSVNFPRTSIADGTDHLRPVTLRGLAPDQVLVLVNGKRRHNTALVHVNGTVGRGSTSVDLNAIPANAIERIEVLRDGAAAQYGSDAIAGVVNIVLKQGERQEATTTFGRVHSTEDGRDHRDGQFVSVNTTMGTLFRQGGFVTANVEFRDRNRTNRAYPDARPQYFPGDARNSNPAAITSWQGDGDMRDVGGFLNAGMPLGGATELYAFGGVTQREGRAAGFFRRANDARTVRSIHPDGFLPEIGSDILDWSGAAGVRGEMRGWRWDLSSVYGSNSFGFNVNNSNNVTMGAQSPTSFDAGRLNFGQWTNNLDLARTIDAGLPQPLSVGIGAEFRLDRYSIRAGEPDSYRDGGVRVLDGPSTGAQGALGAQVFPGFRPADEVSESRNNFAGYLDLETRLVPRLLVNVAGRAEHFSDFGSTADGKVAARLELVEGIALRAAAGTGFRAPSLGQSYFSATSTNFLVINGVNTPFDIRTFPVATEEAQILGATALKAERSLNLSGGVSLDVVPGLVLTADFYAIDINDRIVLSGNFTQAAVRQLFEQRGLRGIGGGRFFTNAIDTETRGFDVVANYGLLLGNAGLLRAIAGYNRNRTEVSRVSETPPELRQFQSTLFDRVERGRIEWGQPRDNINLTLNYTVGGIGLNLHNHRFGEVRAFNADTTGNLDQTFSAKWVTDLDVGYSVLQRLRVSVGANNLLDVYPDEWKDFNLGVAGGLTTSGIYRYAGGVSPMGFNGRTVYFRLSYR